MHLLISQVKLRPTEANLWDIHAAAAKLEANPSPEPIDGSQTALALHSLASVLLSDATAPPNSLKSIVLVTDRLFQAEDFRTYLTASTLTLTQKFDLCCISKALFYPHCSAHMGPSSPLGFFLKSFYWYSSNCSVSFFLPLLKSLCLSPP